MRNHKKIAQVRRRIREARMFARAMQSATHPILAQIVPIRRPGIPLEDYALEDLRREAARPKGCAPFCTISCVHQTAMLDDFREKLRETLAGIGAPPGG